MGSTAEAVDLLRIRAKLRIATGPAPCLRRLHQRPTDTTASPVGLDIPSFHIRHGRARTSFGIGTQAELKESHERAALLGDEHGQGRFRGEGSPPIFVELGRRLIRPELHAELDPLWDVGGFERADVHRLGAERQGECVPMRDVNQSTIPSSRNAFTPELQQRGGERDEPLAAAEADTAGPWAVEEMPSGICAATAGESLKLAGRGVSPVGREVSPAGGGVPPPGRGVPLTGGGLSPPGGGVPLLGGGRYLAGGGVPLAFWAPSLPGRGLPSASQFAGCFSTAR